MTPSILLFTALCLCAGFYLFGRQRAYYRAENHADAFKSRPHFHGWWTGLLAIAPVAILLSLWTVFGTAAIEHLVVQKMPPGSVPLSNIEQKQFFAQILSIQNDRVIIPPTPEILQAASLYSEYKTLLHTILGSLGLGACLVFGLVGLQQTKLDFPAQARVEQVLKLALLLSSIIAVLTTFAIVLSLLFESLRFFGRVPFSNLIGLNWSPQSDLIEGGGTNVGTYGVIPLLLGTLFITFIAMLVAVPVGLMSAIYLTQYAGQRFRKISKPLLEVLAGIPTVVYGFFAALIVAPIIRTIGNAAGLEVASESALAAGLVMGIMIIPFMSSLSDDAMAAVPPDMRNGSFALGATKAETVRMVLLPAALPGIVGAILLSISRAIGETMIVVMAAGFAANLTINPLESVTTVTVQIVKLLTGDQEFDSAKTLSAFALGLMLFVMTLSMNALALFIVRRYRETYE
jgi:phosphate transport system permease protein